MGNSRTTIELNGRLYDARTGRVLSESSAPEPTKQSEPLKRQRQPEPGKILDGFTKRPPAKAQVAQQTKTVAVKQVTPKSAHTTAQHATRKLEKSKTLMRPAVKKPALPKHDVTPAKPTVRAATVSITRQTRAHVSVRSPHVSKFGHEPSPVIKKQAVIPVVAPSSPIPAISKAVTNEIHRLENVLEDANAHLHTLEDSAIRRVPFLQRVGLKNRFANLAAMSFAMLLLVGFFGFQNKTMLEMKVAAQRSGVNADLPDYQPAGYAVIGGVKSEPGKVSVDFKSRTSDQGFSLVQRSSSWNSTALLANHVTKTHCNTCYQTWQNDGKTVYIYDNSNATWVNGGVWYTLEGNANLTSDQLLKIANSL